jgi:hypothetical protein
MAGFIPNFQENTGLYIPTTDIYELSNIANVDVNSEEFKLLMIRLYQNLSNMANALNLKDSAYYVLTQFLTGQQFFSVDPSTPNSYRPSYRIVINVGTLGAGITNTPHGMTIGATWTFTRIYGAASDNGTPLFYPIPFAGAAGSYISLFVDGTNVVIDNNSGVTFNECLVILEFLKN